MPRTLTYALVGILMASSACEAAPDSTDDADLTCGDASRYEAYVPGMEVEGDAGVAVALERAVPGPPEKGDNEWELSIRDADGEPLEDLELVVSPFMPDHGHGSPVDPVVAPDDEPGSYLVTMVFNMGGFWEVTLSMSDADGAQLDEVAFGICIDD